MTERTGHDEPTDSPADATPRTGSLDRRSFLRRAAVTGAAGALLGGGAGFGAGVAVADDNDAASRAPTTRARDGVLAFYGRHQAGIATPAQDRLAFAAFDVNAAASVEDLQRLLGRWSAASARMTAGLEIGDSDTQPQSPPIDTGEALDLPAARLTITVGFGPSLFDQRFGLASKRPAALADLPPFRGEVLDASIGGGDLCVQACADDPQVAFHAIRNLARIGRDTVAMRWSQLGFGRTSTTSDHQSTPRNLMGFKDGTNNIKLEDTEALRRFVWVGSDTDQRWMTGGSYLVARRIQMHIETWDADYIADQQRVFGRVRRSGAPLGGRGEFDPVDLTAKGPDAAPVIDPRAHIRLAAPSNHAGAKILRRGYSYTDGQLSTGQLDAGLFFICFNRDPRTQFVPIQNQLARHDLLNEYTTHRGSALFAVPPGLTRVGDWFGKALFTS